MLIYGTAWKKERTTELVKLAWQNGFRAFDTACQPKHYREDLVGEAIKQIITSGTAREDIYLQTKFTPVNGQDPTTIPYDPQLSLSEQVHASFAVSQKNLHSDYPGGYIDGLLLHSPISPLQSTMEAWRALEDICEAGGAKRIGISNCYDIALFEYLFEQARIKPSILQNRFYQESGYDKALRQFCVQNNVQYQSFWTLTANPHILAHSSVISLSKQMNRSPAQILFRYLHQRSVTPLTGTSSQEHMREDLAISEFSLDDAALNILDNLLAKCLTP